MTMKKQQRVKRKDGEEITTNGSAFNSMDGKRKEKMPPEWRQYDGLEKEMGDGGFKQEAENMQPQCSIGLVKDGDLLTWTGKCSFLPELNWHVQADSTLMQETESTWT